MRVSTLFGRVPFSWIVFVRSSIEAALSEGTTVLCDRYAFSGIAFTFAKSSLASAAPICSTRERLTYEWCRAPDAGLPAPDLTLFLDISPEAAQLRGGYGDERYEKEELQRKVRQVFATIAEDVRRSGGRWVTIDAGRDKDKVRGDIWDYVRELSCGVELLTLGTLWPENLGL